MAEMLDAREDHVDETEREGLSIIRNSIKRINNLINEILDLSTIESKVYQLKTEPLELKPILDELIENYRHFIEQKNIQLHTDIQSHSARLNRVYITQIYDNLFSNAVKFSPENGSVWISLKAGRKNSVFSIRDEGPGFEEAKAKEIFEQYRRQTSMSEQELPPEGLGLAIVYKYTTAMKGVVKLETKPGKGTTFTVEIPTNL